MPDIIKLLPDSVANQIAAGEVVQRPASVVKELLENAIDAGATSIKLIIKDAGRTLIQVIDNGKGMSVTDARLCFERHATSKITDAKDLFAIRTMGFRGEALASIAAVAQVELKSKREEDELGTCIDIEGSVLKDQSACQMPTGTSFTVKNLFFNIPARRNFLKTDHIETSHILEEIHHVALAFPEIAFSFYINDKESIQLPVSSTLKQRIVNLFGKGINDKLIPIEQDLELVKIRGFIGKPEFAKKKREEQYFFVNNRFIKHPYLHFTIMDAYKELITEKTYPAYFIYFDINPASIDINIHPTKTEITFQEEPMIRAVLRSTIKHAIGKSNLSPSLDFERDQSFDIPLSYKDKPVVSPEIKYNPEFNPFKNDPRLPKKDTSNWEKLYPSTADFKAVEQPAPAMSDSSDTIEPPENSHCYSLLNTYIARETSAGLLMVHHEHALTKIFFERYKQQGESSPKPCQQLMFPETLEFSSSQTVLLQNMLENFKSVGFDMDHFGGTTFILRGIPVGTEQSDNRHLIEGVLHDFNQFSDESFDKNNKLALGLAKSIARKKEIPSSSEAMYRIIQELFNCSLPEITPEGKRTFRIYTADDFNKQFD